MLAMTTAYNAVAQSLRDRILSGRLSAGMQLATERELCDEFAASRITIRRALSILEEERLVDRRQGAGTFVTATGVRKIPIVTSDFFGSVSRHAPDMTRRVLRMGWVRPDAELVRTLRVPPGERLLRAQRADEQQGQTVAVDELYLVGSLADRLTDIDLAELDFLTRWEKVQRIELAYGTQTIEAARSSPSDASMMRLRRGAPILRETNVIFLVSGRPAGRFVSAYRPDRFQFEATLNLRSSARRGVS